MSAKKIEIDADEVRMMASFGCTIIEIAKFFKCSEYVIRKRFKDDYEAGQEDMKLKLRQRLLRSIHEDRSIPALIFASKNYLGMSDKTAVDLTGNLEAVLKECGFEDAPIDQTNTKPTEAMEDFGIQPDSTAVARS